MGKQASKIIVYSLAGILLSGVGLPIVQAAPPNKDNPQQTEDQQQTEKRSNAQKQEKQRADQQRANGQKQDQQRADQQRANGQKQDQQRADEQRANGQKQEQQRADQQRSNVQRQEQQRSEQQRSNVQRQEQQRSDQQRANVQRQDQQRQDQQHQQRNNDVRRHEYNNERYRAPEWRESRDNIEHRQPWKWYSGSHVGRRLIEDSRWDREFPGLRSYSWRGRGFWYRGQEFQDLVLFYDDGDLLVSIGFWDNDQFVMIRDDDRSYYNNNPYVLRSRDPIINIQLRL